MAPQSIQPHLVWELVSADGGEVLCTTYQSVEEFCKHACGPELALACVDALPRSALEAENEDVIILPGALTCANVLPRSMLQSANAGEWSRDGLRFVHEEQEYLVRCRIASEEEIVHEPIPEPLSLGCGLGIDVVSDHMEIPTWYVGIYDDETGDWVGEVPLRWDPTRAPARVGELVDRILRIYPEERLPIGPDGLAWRIELVFETVREGSPRSFPEIEREGGA